MGPFWMRAIIHLQKLLKLTLSCVLVVQTLEKMMSLNTTIQSGLVDLSLVEYLNHAPGDDSPQYAPQCPKRNAGTTQKDTENLYDNVHKNVTDTQSCFGSAKSKANRGN